MAGVYLLAPTLSLDNSMTQGLLMGLLSALVYAVRNIILKTQIHSLNGSVLMFYQMVVAAIVLLPVLFLYPEADIKSNWHILLFLGLVTTSIGHTLFLNSFKHFSVSTASLMGGMQTIYGILLAVIFLAEIPTARNMIGGALIILAVVIEGRRTYASSN